MLFKPSHALRNVVSGEITSTVVVVYIAHAEFRLEPHLAREQLDQLCQDILMVRKGWVVNKHDSVCFLLDGRPAFFTAKITGNVPEFEINLTEGGH